MAALAERAHVAAWAGRFADLAAKANHIDVECVVVGRIEGGLECVGGCLGVGARRHQAHA